MRFLIASITLASLIVMSTGCVCGPGGCGPGFHGGFGATACCETGCDGCGVGCEPTCGCGGPSCGIDAGCCEPSCGCGQPGCCDVACAPCCFDPFALVHGVVSSLGSCLFGCHGGCHTGCGELYVDEWASCPPDCCDPCNSCGHYVGHGGGGCGCGDCGCGAPAPRCGRGLASIWGFKYLGGGCGGCCDSGCGCSAGACGSYGSAGGCGCGCSGGGTMVHGGGEHYEGEFHGGEYHGGEHYEGTVYPNAGGYHGGSVIHDGEIVEPKAMERPTVPHSVAPPTETLPEPSVSKTRGRRPPQTLKRRMPSTNVSHIRR